MNGVQQHKRAPDTPMEVITDLLHRALLSEDPTASKALVQRAYDVASGLDEYLETVSSPPSEVSLRATSCCTVRQVAVLGFAAVRRACSQCDPRYNLRSAGTSSSGP
jgi:hypothetical protein